MKSTFLSELARELVSRNGGDISSYIVLFPSLRARTFFIDAISGIIDTPVWQPTWSTIDELMEHISGIRRTERILLISELFNIYVKYHPNETFDRFYFWGEMLISDFDMIDKYLVDASQLLRNIEEIKELEADISYLTPEQLRIIKFWKSIGDRESLSEQKIRFLEVWRTLPKVYDDYRKRLQELGVGYNGMIYRVAAEKIKSGADIDIINKCYIIAGFNALSNSEKVLFDYLQNSEHGAEFFWDYDCYYYKDPNHEAGHFLRDNIMRYGESDTIYNNNFDTDKQITALSCTSNIVQCKYVAELLRRLPSEELNKQTAIVLTDENLLIPLLHSLPDCVKKVNITMGYPLKSTLVYSFIERLISLQNHSRAATKNSTFYHADVTGLLLHPYVTACDKKCSEKLYKHITQNHIISVDEETLIQNDINRLIFRKINDWISLSQYILDILSYIVDHAININQLQVEYLHTAYDEVGKVARSLNRCNITPKVEIYTSFLRRHLQSVTIPYEGEPLEGLQVMGILETRNIDFKNVIVLSMTDINFPGNHADHGSFIPYNLRVAYNLPTIEQHEAMYAYYFYRLIQRAESVNLLYCSSSDKMSTGERSRYIYQLEYESKHDIKKVVVGVDLNADIVKPITIDKDEKIRSTLDRYLLDFDDDRHLELSATSFFRYIECPLKFYFATIAHVHTTEEVDDNINALTLGNILHHSMDKLYQRCKNVSDPKKQISTISKDEIIETVNLIMSELLFASQRNRANEFTGDMLLVRDIISKYIKRGIIHHDMQRDGYTIIGLEEKIRYSFPIDGERKVNFAGTADRIDKLSDGSLQVIDYKSGQNPHLHFKSIDSLFTGGTADRISNVFQTLLYSMILNRTHKCEVTPSLYYASQMLSEDYSPLLKVGKQIITQYSEYAESYERELSNALEELFDYDKPFEQADAKMCNNCDFLDICRRRSEQKY